uniref:Lrrc15_12 protein n=1 Tax=Fopius arisanus TaxID=64838 RepID=A0A0C9QPB7_9HYME
MNKIVGLNLFFFVSSVLGNDEVCKPIMGSYKLCRKSNTLTRVITDNAFLSSLYLFLDRTDDTTIGPNAFSNLNLNVLSLYFPYPKYNDPPTIAVTLLPNSLVGLSELKNLTIKNANINFGDGNPLSSLVLLQELEISKSNFTEIPTDMLAMLPNLEDLSLEGNQIRKIEPKDLLPLKHLKRLDLSYNDITDIKPGTFDEFNALRTLDLSFNSFPVVPGLLRGLSCLKLLRISKSFDHNGFQSEMLSDVPNLDELQLDFNNLSTLSPDMFQNLRSLRVLSLYGNKIRDIPRGVFDQMPSLKDISIADNEIETITPGAFGDSDIDTVNLSLNPVRKTIQTDTFRGLTVRRLILSKCKIAKLESKAFNGLQVTQMLDLTENDLTEVGVDDFSGLRTKNLDLSQNRIAAITKDAFKMTAMERFGLYGNPIKDRVKATEWGIKSSVVIMK